VIPHFPDPYDGELLYSVLARFAERMGYPALHTSLLELFGVRHGIPAIELPNKIDQLVSALPPGTIYTADSIIQKNTLLGLYSPFLPDRNYELIVANMKGDGVRTTQLRAGIVAGRINPPEFFRTCPACDEENLARYGETYWHRLHQLSGVEICPVHSVFLENTNVRLHGSARGDALISAESAQRAGVARRVDPEKPDIQVLLRIAASAAWLLDKNTSRPGLIEINRGYHQVLDSNGCSSKTGRVRQKRLRARFAEYCTADLLKQFGCELRDAGDGGWLGRLPRETEQAIAPLRHLLLMAVLNVSAEEFFTRALPESATHRQQPVYPCLNRICPQFRRPVIPKFEVKRANHGFARVFECPHCGHRSSRAVDGRSVIRVVSFGALWKQKLQSFWGDGSLSLRDVSTELDADDRSVLKYAAKLGLEFPRRGPGKLTTTPGRQRAVKRVPPATVIEEKRRAWLQLRDQHPHAGISELHQLASALYTWLYRNDRQWFNVNSPARRRFVPKNDRVDWNARDAELVSQVTSTAVRIKNHPGRPRRVTLRSIGLALGIQTQLQMRKDKLPRTKAALKVHVESTEQVVLRRIQWTVETLKIRCTRATRSEIMSVAGIGSTALRIPSVRQAIIAAKEYLDRSLNGSLLSIQAKHAGAVDRRKTQIEPLNNL
jgi:hypothetical protein